MQNFAGRILIPALVILLYSSGAAAASEGPVMPGGYRLPAYLKPVTLRPVFRPEPLLAAARQVMESIAFVAPGERVLIVSDSSINPILVEAFERAAREKSASVDTHSLSPPASAGTAGLLQQQQWKNWWPAQTWEAASLSDVVVALAYINPEFLKDSPLARRVEGRSLRFVSVTAVPELLADPGALYPKEILDLLSRKVSAHIRAARRLRITDPAGTDLTLEKAMVTEAALPSFPYSPTVQVEPGNSADGVLVSHAASTGFVPLLRVGVKASRVVLVEGGGEVGELMRLQSPALQLREISWSLHPKRVRAQQTLEGSAAIHNQLSSAGRAGAMQVRFWSRDRSHSFDTQVYFPTLLADGREVIREGYPLDLVDPEVVRLAESLGGTELLAVQCTVLPGRTPEPKTPKTEPVSAASSLLPALTVLVRDVARIQEGETVAIVTDESVSPLVNEGLQLALAETGAKIKIVKAEVPPPETEPGALFKQITGHTLSPDLVKSLEDADCILSPSYFDPESMTVQGEDFDSWLESGRKRWVGVVAIPELLVSKWASYPPALLEAIAAKVEQTLAGESTIILSSNQGTSLIYDYQTVRSAGGRHWSMFPGNIRFRLVPGKNDVEGVIVSSTALSGPAPRIEVTVGSSKIIAVDGSASTTEALRTATEQGGFLELSFGVNPKPFAVPSELTGFSPILWSRYAAAQRAGIVSLLMGSWPGARNPFSLQILFPTLNAGGQKIVIDLGRLKALDDPEVQGLAAQWDADLLVEEWIPAIGVR